MSTCIKNIQANSVAAGIIAMIALLLSFLIIALLEKIIGTTVGVMNPLAITSMIAEAAIIFVLGMRMFVRKFND